MIIEAKGISKKYKNKCVLQNIDLKIDSGEVIGLIGPNGSGKTTLLNIFMNIIQSYLGSLKIQSGARLGMSVSRMGFFEDMDVQTNVKMYASLGGGDIKNLNDLYDFLSIDYKSLLYKELSAGMKQKVSLLLSFLRQYDLTLLDEPTNHLDVDSIIALRKLILERKKLGDSFLIASHVLSDLEKICDRVIFIKAGVVVATEETNSLIRKYGDLEKAYSELLETKITEN
ncbi:MAG: ABC transporter ATP-binding protein [Cyclobacteriaceae bacterium]|nr:ABC transporter ATP-binding protein [Cyclobacteriaceae bacterium]UYN87369.1 MAG: ABC transporter ATP-binding protein [Cyclobacteriaceae bacterium]